MCPGQELDESGAVHTQDRIQRKGHGILDGADAGRPNGGQHPFSAFRALKRGSQPAAVELDADVMSEMIARINRQQARSLRCGLRNGFLGDRLGTRVQEAPVLLAATLAPLRME